VNLRDFGQPLIPTGKRFGLQTHIGATENVSLSTRRKKLTAFLELESAIRSGRTSRGLRSACERGSR
jgi:hypothetical protein